MGELPPGRHAPRSAHAVFFPAAAVYAAVAVPLSVHGMVTGTPLLPGFGAVSGHAHVLLFGYALAVVAGFLINRVGSASLALLFILWLAARIAFLLGAAVLATICLVRWQLWRCRERPDLLCLGIGCSWLITGLVILGSAGLLGRPHSVAGTHTITVGGLGTLTAAVLLRIPPRRPRQADPTAIYNQA